MNLQKLKREIEHQTRNERKNVYIKVSDINELINGNSKEIHGEKRIYINIETINKLIEGYENNEISEQKEINKFKEKLKVDMPDYKLTRIDEHGYKFEPIKEDKERE